MSVTAWILVVLTLATVALIVLQIVSDEQSAHLPRHSHENMQEKTRRLRASSLPPRRPPTVALIPDPGESEWRFPPAP